MINFEIIKNYLDNDKRFTYMHDLLNKRIEVFIKNSESKFDIIQDTHGIKVISGIGSLTGIFKISFNINSMDLFRTAIETIYKSSVVLDYTNDEKKLSEEDKMAEINHILADYNAISDFDYQPKEVEPGVSATDIELALDAYNYVVAKYKPIEGDPAFNAAYGSDVNIFISRDKDKWVFQCKYLDERKTYEEDNIEEINSILLDYSSLSDYNRKSKETVEYPKGGNTTMHNQTVSKSFDFLNDYKVVKLAERAINDNFAELANDFIKYSNPEEDSGTILSCGNSKVLFSATRTNRKIIIEFGRDGEEPFRYTYTNNSINLLNDYDPKALITIGNLIESAVESWLEKDRTRADIDDLNERAISVVDNIKTMIGLINSTIGKYNA